VNGKRIPKRNLESNITGKRSVGKPKKWKYSYEDFGSEKLGTRISI
jgi:hypothetical protein